MTKKAPKVKDQCKADEDTKLAISAGYKRFYDSQDPIIHVSISRDEGKIIGISSINTLPQLNEFCENMSKNKACICSECYAIRALETYRKNAVPCYVLNSLILVQPIPIEKLPVIKTELGRFNAFGELFNMVHLENLLNICRKNPLVKFSLFSKRLDLICKIENKPGNLTIVYSNPKIDSPIKKVVPCSGIDIVFNVLSPAYIETNNAEKKVNCSGTCNDCRLCYNSSKKVIYEVLK
jgi:hypothetical protein